jgi:hypothetical protein
MRGKSEALLIIMGLFLIVSLCLGPAGAKAQGMEQGIAEAMQAARAAGVPEVALNRVLTLSLERSVSPQYVSSFLTTLRLARMNDLAVEPFLLKIEEGLAKGIPPKSIALALERKIDDYRFVQNLVRRQGPMNAPGALPAEDLTVLVDSLSAGVSRQELKRFIETAPPVPSAMLAIAVDNLALLKQTDLKADLINRMLMTGLRLKGFTPSWRYLAKAVVAAQAKGISGEQIVEATVAALEEKRDLRELMYALGFTSRDLRRGPGQGYE